MAIETKTGIEDYDYLDEYGYLTLRICNRDNACCDIERLKDNTHMNAPRPEFGVGKSYRFQEDKLQSCSMFEFPTNENSKLPVIKNFYLTYGNDWYEPNYYRYWGGDHLRMEFDNNIKLQCHPPEKLTKQEDIAVSCRPL